MLFQPVERVFTKVFHKVHQLGGVLVSCNARHLVLGCIPLRPTRLEVTSVILSLMPRIKCSAAFV